MAVAVVEGYVVVRELGTADMSAASQVLSQIWQRRGGSPVDAAMLVALSHSGGYVSGAFVDQALVGVCVGLLASPAGEVLHSHIAGVLREHAGQGIGRRLKEHQWRWCSGRGFRSITWTFDPIIARNAYFNFHQLGVEQVEYLVDFYGALQDELNGGQATDRLMVSWPIRLPPHVPKTEVRGELPHRVLEITDDGWPGDTVDPSPASEWCSVALPHDVELMRRESPDRAAQWRQSVREVLPALFSDGWRVADVDRSGTYLLRRT